MSSEVAREPRAEPRGTTIADFVRDQYLSLNALRLALALLVLVSHTFPLGGYGADPGWPTLRPSTTLGGFGVGGFFALSGLLVTMSAMRSDASRFVRARFLRIVPAYAAVLVLTAVALAPVIYLATHDTLSGYWNLAPGGPITYVVRNLFFPVGLQFGINDVFATTTPYGELVGASVINGSLWTLPLEVRCYVIALLVVVVGRSIGLTRTAIAAAVIVGGLLVTWDLSPDAAAAVTPEWLPPDLLQLLFVFLCGAVVATVASRVRMTWAVVIGVSLVFGITSIVGGLPFRTIGLGSLALLLPLVGALLPRAGLGFFRHDLSYGSYIWAFPVQQTLAFAGLVAVPWVFLSGATALTLVLAAGSWFLVERPALRLKNRPRARAEVSTAPASSPEPSPPLR